MQYLQLIGVMILILGAFFVGIHLLKRYVPSIAGNQSMKVVEQLHLGDRCRVLVVRVRDEEILLGVTRERVSILEKLPAREAS
jgi:flagellar protein FliO/FliZ